jgi:hypothetical protein
MTDKQRRFVNFYVGEANFNATEAARLAGYAHPNIQFAEVKAHPEVAAAIEAHMQQHTLSANEVLKRLSDHARGTLAHFVRFPDEDSEDPEVYFDLSSPQAKEYFHLLKKTKKERTSGGSEEHPWVTVKHEIEIHDPQAALRDLGRHYKLFTDRQETEMDVSIYDGLTDEEIEQRIAALEGRKIEAPSSEVS